MFSFSQRRRWIHRHRHRHCNRPNLHDVVTSDILFCYTQCQPLGLRHIRTKSYQLSVTKLRSIQQEALRLNVLIPNSPEYKPTAISLDIARFRLFNPAQTGSSEESTKRNFLKLEFRNKSLAAVSISNTQNHKKVKSAVPPYFKSQSPYVVSYSYSAPISSKIFNYKTVLQSLNTEDITFRPSVCTCQSSKAVQESMQTPLHCVLS